MTVTRGPIQNMDPMQIMAPEDIGNTGKYGSNLTMKKDGIQDTTIAGDTGKRAVMKHSLSLRDIGRQKGYGFPADSITDPDGGL